MKFLKENKKLILKYLFILISNILIYILCNYYLRNLEYKEFIMLFVILIVDFIIYYYKGIVKFNYYLNLLVSLITNIILLFFIKNEYLYGINVFSIGFANNFIYMRNRTNDKLSHNIFQYILLLLNSLLILFIGLCLFFMLKK